jgi:hypothetical protein
MAVGQLTEQTYNNRREDQRGESTMARPLCAYLPFLLQPPSPLGRTEGLARSVMPFHE